MGKRINALDRRTAELVCTAALACLDLSSTVDSSPQNRLQKSFSCVRVRQNKGMNMKNRLLLFVFANCLLLAVSFLQANAFKVIDDRGDLEVAASHKHSSHHEKGHEADHHHHHEEDKGEKGDKGYESKHG